MNMKATLLILAMLMIGFCAAPSWIRPGVNLTYSVGSSSVSFKVLDVTNDNLRIQIDSRTINENASADYGQFWLYSSQLSSMSVGQTIGDFTIISEGRQTFAAKEWNTLTFEGVLSGATTTKVIDKDSGLLLRQTVSVSGAPAVSLTQYAVPAWITTPAPTQNTTAPPRNTTTPTTTPSPAPSPTPTPSPNQNTTRPPVNSTTAPQVAVPQVDTSNQTPPDDLEPPKSFSCCAPSALLLVVLVGGLIIRSK
jgi:hypothetical protein